MFTIDSPQEHCAKGNEDEGSIPVTPSTGSKRSQRNPSITVPKSRSSSPGRKDVGMRRTKRKINHNSRDISEDTRNGDKEGDTQGFFFVDLNPDAVPLTNQDGQSTASVANEEKLLLPSHVTVLGSTPVEIVEFPLSVSKEEDFIKYLDYEDTKVCLL
jgi:hypothetical protein